jgi:D-threo-aldose 1-dehydrogenase
MSIKDKWLSGSLGLGAAPLGNMFRNIPDHEAAATVDAAWQQGTRYCDTAPFYGAGPSEIRLGKELAKHKRNEYVLRSIDDSLKCLGAAAYRQVTEEMRHGSGIRKY